MKRSTAFYLIILLGSVAGQCPLCFDGSEPPDPSFVPGGRLRNLTCAALFYGASVSDPEGDDLTCEDWLLIGLQCGCPPPPGGCPLCHDGSLPPVFEKEVLDSTCGIFVSTAGNPNTDAEAPTCDQWLRIGVLCDCPVPDGSCNLCEDGSPIPEPDRMLGLDRCFDVTAVAAFAEGQECSAWQATAGVYCGCNNPVASEGYCRICGDGNLLPDPGFVPLVANNTERSCGQLEFNRDGLSCDELQNQYSEACCSCHFCYDGSEPPDLQTIPDDPAFGGATCKELYERSMVPSADVSCEFYNQAGLSCGCPVPSSSCSLCEDGSDLPDSELVLVSRTCQDFETIAMSSPRTECSAFQATIGVYCGCTNPIASEGYCRVCGDDTPLPDPSVIAYVDASGNEVSCGEVELNIDSPTSCEAVQRFSQTCCNSMSSVSPISSPAAIPVSAPTSSIAPVSVDPLTPAADSPPTTSAASTLQYKLLILIITVVLVTVF